MMPVSMRVMTIIMRRSDVRGPGFAGRLRRKRRDRCSMCGFTSGRAYEAQDRNRKSKTSHCWSPVRQRTSDAAVPHPQPLGTLIDALAKSGGTEGLGRLSFRRFTFSVTPCIGGIGAPSWVQNIPASPSSRPATCAVCLARQLSIKFASPCLKPAPN